MLVVDLGAKRLDMDKKRVEYYKKRLTTAQDELMRLVTKSERDGREADEEATQDVADKAANSYTKEFLFHQSDENRRPAIGRRSLGPSQKRHLRPLCIVSGRSPGKTPGGGSLGAPLHRVPGKAGPGSPLSCRGGPGGRPAAAGATIR